ncbi:HAD family phosphatase [soil metagenome]
MSYRPFCIATKFRNAKLDIYNELTKLYSLYIVNNPEKHIKNIIFDLGGVLINIDYNILIAAFSKIGLPHFEDYFSQKQQSNLFDDYENGRISSDTFRKKIKEHCQPNTSNIEIDAAWNSMILDLPKERMNLLMSLKGKYRTFLLSNTNEIHMQFIYKYLKKEFHINDFSSCFEKVYLSFEMGMRKPDVQIFEKVLNDNDLNKDETLFIDDSIQHIESAKLLGVMTYYLDVKREKITDIFIDEQKISLSILK